MKGDLHKWKFLSLVLSVIILFLSVFGLVQYKEKIKYGQFISIKKTQDFSDLVRKSIDIFNINKEILDNDVVSSEQIDLLQTKSFFIQQTYQYNSGLTKLSFFEKMEMDNSLNKALYEIHRFYMYNVSNDSSLVLDPSMKEKLEYINLFYGIWLNKLDEELEEVNFENGTFSFEDEDFENEYGTKMVFSSTWPELYSSFSQAHNDFLRESELISIEQVLNNSYK